MRDWRSRASRRARARRRVIPGLALLAVVATGCQGGGSTTPATSGPSGASAPATDPGSTDGQRPDRAGTGPSSDPTPPRNETGGSAVDPDGVPAPMPASWELTGVLASVDATRDADVAEVQAATLDLLDTAEDVVVASTRDVVHAATGSGPITTGTIELDRDGVRARLALALPSAPRELVLRLLAASSAVGPSSDDVSIRAIAAGESVPVTIDTDLDRVVVDLGTPRADGVVLGLDLEYALPSSTDLVAAGGPGGYGLLADHGDVVTLGHWLPAVVAIDGNDGAVPAWGDLGAFDAGTWIVDVDVPGGTLRTGGVDRTTPDGRQRAMGFGLRDLAAAWFPDATLPTVTTTSTGVEVVTSSADGVDDPAVGDLSARQMDWLAATWTELPWPEFDAVRAPILPAAGMEFPGLVIMDDTFWDPAQVPTEFTLIHEWGHQYAHALVGNGSLSDPVVDEPLAQYLSWRWFLDERGPGFADGVARQSFDDDIGVVLEPPGQPAGDFTTGEAYGVAIYRTAASAWHSAAQDHGVEVVDDAVAAVFDQAALQEVDEERLLEIVATTSPAVAKDLATAFDG